ncbi:hypothetical protein CC1G_06119 [Coprinopsis cinerea okayama7|uniref:Uncharacterized protein n=1 Tax=Coprinopsis cinerea (strain Okayama-7 / 130 / ATCC MYA-4618 / FGSC 9003) TaxID=240176 RepID=A8PA84_COPC7|nr:hypothetical protein CC1G_06119 [Coprinopsis cinerea okayama7\|eukprot:XP_001839929.1 hypothetical protein CC1G_06119 [Coprinopsis cinerea okayama7\
MSSTTNTTNTPAVKATFQEIVMHATPVQGVRSDIVHVECGSCKAVNEATIPREVFYVVTAGTSIGVFTNLCIADSFVSGVPRAVYSVDDAYEALLYALSTKTAHLITPKTN